MQRFKIFSLYVVLAIIVAGIFGSMHDQISYTISSEYFTRFKFPMFHLTNNAVPERIRAAEVGFLASWWMGIPLGILTGLAGFIHKNPNVMRIALLWSLLLIAGFTLIFALAGLTYGYYQTQDIQLSQYSRWYIPKDVEYLRPFLCVGYMHNSAYIGGVFSIPVAWIYHIVVRFCQFTKA